MARRKQTIQNLSKIERDFITRSMNNETIRSLPWSQTCIDSYKLQGNSFKYSTFLFKRSLFYGYSKALQVLLLFEYNLTDQVLNLLPRSYQFKCHKPQGNWRHTWSLTPGSWRISRGACKLIRTPMGTQKKVLLPFKLVIIMYFYLFFFFLEKESAEYHTWNE